ncbi:hypothetical protein QLX08_010128 [Tetragonisca angustula]|uniref:Uncharacterized protein n=1 Tax=Tetragonisca angustula TaxID=166442 RepID=A0AAW0ZG00_9HYME
MDETVTTVQRFGIKMTLKRENDLTTEELEELLDEARKTLKTLRKSKTKRINLLIKYLLENVRTTVL